MFCTKYKKRIQELESYEKTYEQRIENQSGIIDKLNNRNKELEMQNDKLELERWSEGKVLSSLKQECLEKGEQINKLQELVNKRKDNPQDQDNVEELKRTIEKQAGEIGRLEAWKKRMQQKGKHSSEKAGKSAKKGKK